MIMGIFCLEIVSLYIYIKFDEYFIITYQGPRNMSVMVSIEVNIEKVIQYISHIP